MSQASLGGGSAGAAVVVNDLHKRFAELEVLKGVSLTANEGDVVSMIGSSGSGKSTFLRCINFLEHPTEGSISVTGEAVALAQGPRRRLRRLSEGREGLRPYCSGPAASGPSSRSRPASGRRS